VDKVDVMGGTGKNQSQAEQICLYIYMQETFIIPSARGSMPKGKLYSKVSNILCMKQELGGNTTHRQTDDAACAWLFDVVWLFIFTDLFLSWNGSRQP